MEEEQKKVLCATGHIDASPLSVRGETAPGFGVAQSGMDRPTDRMWLVFRSACVICVSVCVVCVVCGTAAMLISLWMSPRIRGSKGRKGGGGQ